MRRLKSDQNKILPTINTHEPLIKYKNIIKSIIDSTHTQFNLDDYSYIPTIKYRHQIELYCNQLKAKCGFDKFAFLIIHNNQSYWLSNTYNDLAIPHDIFRLQQIDLATIEASYIEKDHFFPCFDICNSLYDLYKIIIEDIYHIYIRYVLVRSCFECRIILFAASTQPLSNLEDCKEVYQKTFKNFENFAIDFFNANIHALALFSPKIKYARVYHDANFRNNLIKMTCQEVLSELTNQEIMCLHWSSYGKTAEETANIMGISSHTVRQHIKDVIAKLQSSNITSAVYKAKCLSII